MCNLECDYCPQGDNAKKKNLPDLEDAAQSYWIDDLIRMVELAPRGVYQGISYSGGEPFMYFDKIVRFANAFNRIDQSIYQWMYTNGMLATEDKMKMLADLNIQEIRFHLGASNFNEQAIRNLEKATKIFPHVNVETPSNPMTADILMDGGLLQRLVDVGVEQINLPEMYLSSSQQLNYNGDDLYYYSSAARGAHVSPINSRPSTYDVMDFVEQNNIDIIVNDCSHESRDVQVIKKSFNPFRQIVIE